MLDLALKLPAGDPLRLLCIGAHCDDIEIGAGGTVRRLIEEHPAVDVRWVVFSATPEREAEARASAAHFLAGAREVDVDVQGFRESYFPDEWAAIKDAFFRVREAFSPDVVLTHHRADLHQDHRVLGELTWNTFRDHVVLEYEVPKFDGGLGEPGVFVPLSAEHVTFKLEALARFYRSQADKPWFDAEAFRSILRLRGLECNAPSGHAEAFHGRKLRL